MRSYIAQSLKYPKAEVFLDRLLKPWNENWMPTYTRNLKDYLFTLNYLDWALKVRKVHAQEHYLKD